MILFNPVVLSVIVMIVLCLFKLNVIFALLIAAMVAGVTSGMGLQAAMSTLIGGMGGNAETALSYILLGTFAVAISKTGLATILAKKIATLVKGNKIIFVLTIAIVASFSQNLVPVHIAFIPILIPPLIPLMNKMKLDRRAVSCALTFGLKAPYVALPVGFGLIFHNIIRDNMILNGLDVTTGMIWRSMWVAGLAMVFGLLLAVFFGYRKDREYEDIKLDGFSLDDDIKMSSVQWFTLLATVVTFVIQLQFGSLPLGALAGLTILVASKSIKWNEIEELVEGGLKMMAMIAFIMLIAAGYATVIRETGGIDELVVLASSVLSIQIVSAFVLLLIGLLITMGIGTSFGTIPILAAIYVPMGIELGFSVAGIILLIGTAAALGDAGSPASDSTLGPTAGLSIDGQHEHIWDTCVPTFMFFNIPLIIFGAIGSVLL